MEDEYKIQFDNSISLNFFNIRAHFQVLLCFCALTVV